MQGTCQVEPVAALLEVQQHASAGGSCAPFWTRRAEVLDGALQVFARLGAHAGHMVGASGHAPAAAAPLTRSRRPAP